MKPTAEATPPLFYSIPSDEFHCIEIIQFGLPPLDDGNIFGIDVVVDHRGIVWSVDLVHVRNAKSHHDAYLELQTKQVLIVVSTELPGECLKIGKILKEICQLIDCRLATEPIDIDDVWGGLEERIDTQM